MWSNKSKNNLSIGHFGPNIKEKKFNILDYPQY